MFKFLVTGNWFLKLSGNGIECLLSRLIVLDEAGY